MRLNWRLNPAVNLSHQDLPAAAGSTSSWSASPRPAAELACGTAWRNREQNSGITVMATTYEANSEITTARASAENRNLLTPNRKVTGKKTTTVVSVAASTARLTSEPPASA